METAVEQHIELKIEPDRRWLSNFYKFFPIISDCLTKTCTACKKDKAIEAFPFNIKYSFGVSMYCYDCSASKRAERKAKDPLKATLFQRKSRAKIAELRKMGLLKTPISKFCTKCRTEKPASDFSKAEGKSDGLASSCRE